MPLEFKNLPLEISALIQDFWIPRGYKIDTVMQELSARFLVSLCPGALHWESELGMIINGKNLVNGGDTYQLIGL